FLEMNTRLQVEHPVTELVTGVDLVREMVRIAAGEPLSIPADGIAPRGHAIEARIYAEDPAKNFLPSPGEITAMTEPAGPHIRIDAGAAPGSKVTVYYDPLIAKLIVWGDDRPAALATMRDALAHYEIDGVKTNLPLLRRLFADADVQAGRISTRFVDERLAAIMSV
ncbi:MAG TPA: acetyl-CoA carboxylase biotin carboxylase subunit, partial [Thermomicrobiales bacterium]|nr:acetyl-CoA carboxylase biotin carboxylase subunit [Thermomicrobiales bacterium]